MDPSARVGLEGSLPTVSHTRRRLGGVAIGGDVSRHPSLLSNAGAVVEYQPNDPDGRSNAGVGSESSSSGASALPPQLLAGDVVVTIAARSPAGSASGVRLEASAPISLSVWSARSIHRHPQSRVYSTRSLSRSRPSPD